MKRNTYESIRDELIDKMFIQLHKDSTEHYNPVNRYIDGDIRCNVWDHLRDVVMINTSSSVRTLIVATLQESNE